MHIPDNLLDPRISLGLFGAAAAALSYCLDKIRAVVTAWQPAEALAAAGRGLANFTGRARTVLTGDGRQQLCLMGLLAAVIFIAQLFDFSIGQGTSGHFMGGALAAIIVGPFGGTLVISAVLIVQALFLADGGVLALGANIINMALIGAFVSYYLYAALKPRLPEWLAISITAWISVVAAAAACAVMVGLSGQNSLSGTVAAMLRNHAVIGLAEIFMTLAGVKLFRAFSARGKEPSR